MTEMSKAIVAIHSAYTSYVSNRRRSHGANRLPVVPELPALGRIRCPSEVPYPSASGRRI